MKNMNVGQALSEIARGKEVFYSEMNRVRGEIKRKLPVLLELIEKYKDKKIFKVDGSLTKVGLELLDAVRVKDKDAYISGKYDNLNLCFKKMVDTGERYSDGTVKRTSMNKEIFLGTITKEGKFEEFRASFEFLMTTCGLDRVSSAELLREMEKEKSELEAKLRELTYEIGRHNCL